MTEHSKEPPELAGEVWRGRVGEAQDLLVVDDRGTVWLDRSKFATTAGLGWDKSNATWSGGAEAMRLAFLDASARCSAALAASDLGAKMAREAERRAERAEARAKRAEDFVRNCRDNFDCDDDAHRYSTTCRACDAGKVLAP